MTLEFRGVETEFSKKKREVYRGIFLAHFRTILFAAVKVDASWSSGTAFHTRAIRFVASVGYPGTGSLILFEDTNLVFLKLGCSLKRHFPKGFMDCFAFQTVIAVIEATASLRHFSLAF